MKLSICIPTLNREDFIKDTLDSLIINNSPEIEIIIVDGSKENITKDIIDEYILKGLKVKYMKSDSFIGMDLDVSQAVKESKGDYCWLMSDDDTLVDGAIEIVLEKIRSKHDLYIMNILFCDKDLNIFGASNFLNNYRKTNIFNIAIKESFLEYVDASTSNNALLCFMPAIVFKRTNWFKSDDHLNGYVFGYNHVYKLLRPTQFLSKYIVEYIPETLLKNRSFNDSYSSSGILKRYLIDFEGYLKLSEQIFEDDLIIKKAFINNMKKEHGMLRIIKLRLSINYIDWKKIKILLLKTGYHKLFINTISVIHFFKLDKFFVPILHKANMSLKYFKAR